MQAQEVFDRTAAHLFSQDQRAIGEKPIAGNICAYRGADGVSRCAVGFWIKDEDYDPKMEGRGVYWLDQNHPASVQEVNDHLDMLGQLQTVHDRPWNWDSTAAMHKALGEVAEDFYLNMRVVSSLSFGDR